MKIGYARVSTREQNLDMQVMALEDAAVNDPDQYHGLIKSSGKINTSLIKSEKRGIMRILLSLLLQQNTQSIIIRNKKFCLS